MLLLTPSHKLVQLGTKEGGGGGGGGGRGTGNLQGFQAHHPSTYMGGGDSMVRTALAIGKGVDDTQSI